MFLKVDFKISISLLRIPTYYGFVYYHYVIMWLVNIRLDYIETGYFLCFSGDMKYMEVKDYEII